MFVFENPTDETVTRVIAAQADADYSYDGVGTTADPTRIPPGYLVDRYRVRLGSGDATWERAKAAIRAWKMFDFNWLRLISPDTPIEPGRMVAVVPDHFGFHSINVSRIVYAFDEETAEGRRFGFAYGTLPAHVETGEERFEVFRDAADDAVWYRILAFSRPAHPLALLGFPVARIFQKRFGADSTAAMARATQA
jgi:uncharacterized protein (UPF0548 family)